MADLATSGVTLISEWTEGSKNGRLLGCRKLELVLSAMGSATNKITAAVLGFTKIVDASPASADGNDHIYVAAPSYDGTLLLLKASATDAPADITDTVRIVVRGE